MTRSLHKLTAAKVRFTGTVVALTGIAVALLYFSSPNKHDPSPYTPNKVTTSEGAQIIFYCDKVGQIRSGLVWDCVPRSGKP
jgi:hypothetical protein